jgi:hypothetical protein
MPWPCGPGVVAGTGDRASASRRRLGPAVVFARGGACALQERQIEPRREQEAAFLVGQLDDVAVVVVR